MVSENFQFYHDLLSVPVGVVPLSWARRTFRHNEIFSIAKMAGGLRVNEVAEFGAIAYARRRSDQSWCFPTMRLNRHNGEEVETAALAGSRLGFSSGDWLLASGGLVAPRAVNRLRKASSTCPASIAGGWAVLRAQDAH
jgi:hypothetical protein